MKYFTTPHLYRALYDKYCVKINRDTYEDLEKVLKGIHLHYDYGMSKKKFHVHYYSMIKHVKLPFKLLVRCQDIYQWDYIVEYQNIPEEYMFHHLSNILAKLHKPDRQDRENARYQKFIKIAAQKGLFSERVIERYMTVLDVCNIFVNYTYRQYFVEKILIKYIHIYGLSNIASYERGYGIQYKIRFSDEFLNYMAPYDPYLQFIGCSQSLSIEFLTRHKYQLGYIWRRIDVTDFSEQFIREHIKEIFQYIDIEYIIKLAQCKNLSFKFFKDYPHLMWYDYYFITGKFTIDEIIEIATELKQGLINTMRSQRYNGIISLMDLKDLTGVKIVSDRDFEDITGLHWGITDQWRLNRAEEQIPYVCRKGEAEIIEAYKKSIDILT